MFGVYNLLLEEDIIELNKIYILILILLFYSYCKWKLLLNIFWLILGFFFIIEIIMKMLKYYVICEL